MYIAFGFDFEEF